MAGEVTPRQLRPRLAGGQPHRVGVAVALAANLTRALEEYRKAVRATYADFHGPDALRAVAFFARAERHRKTPWRLVGALGPALLMGYATGTLGLDAAFTRLSRRTGASLRAVVLDDAAPGPAAEAFRRLAELISAEVAPPVEMAGCTARMLDLAAQALDEWDAAGGSAAEDESGAGAGGPLSA